MADQRLAAALSRIETALARLEERPADVVSGQRHERLREAARETLAGLDRLLERQT